MTQMTFAVFLAEKTRCSLAWVLFAWGSQGTWRRKVWTEALTIYRHAVTLVWISIDLVRRLLVATKVGEVRKY